MIDVLVAAENDLDGICEIDSLVIRNSSRKQFLHNAISNGHCFTAKHHSVIVGFAVFNTSFYDNGFISLVIVSPEYRRNGVAAALIRYIERVCSTAKIFTSTNESNTAAKRLFESLGYTKSGHIQNLDEGDAEVVYYNLLSNKSWAMEIKEIDESIKNDLESFRGSIVVSRGKIHQIGDLPGFVFLLNGKVSGLITYHISNEQCEIVSLDSKVENRGIGSKLIELVIQKAKDSRCKRVWLITSNDNIHAIRFYQKRGFNMIAVHLDAITEARKLKPTIPITGIDEIAVRHEIEFEFVIPFKD